MQATYRPGDCLLRLWGCLFKIPNPLSSSNTPPSPPTNDWEVVFVPVWNALPRLPGGTVDEEKASWKLPPAWARLFLVLLPVLQYMQDPGTYIGCAVPPFRVPRLRVAIKMTLRT